MAKKYFADIMNVWSYENERFSAKGDIVVNRQRLSTHNNCIVVCNASQSQKYKEALSLNTRKKISRYAQEALLTQFYLLNQKASFSTIDDFENMIVQASNVVDQYCKKVIKEKVTINGFIIFSNNSLKNPEHYLFTFGNPHMTFLDSKSQTNSVHLDVHETKYCDQKVFNRQGCTLSSYKLPYYPIIIMNAETEWLDLPVDIYYQLWWEDEDDITMKIQSFIDENALLNTLPITMIKINKDSMLEKKVPYSTPYEH